MVIWRCCLKKDITTNDPVINYFKLAAADPHVTEIKVTQYRVSHSSPIMEALIEAAEAGKKVFVFIEVKARFDEEKNLKWGERLEKAGVKVHYSLPGRKVHAKMAVVTRVVKKVKTHYTYLSTGNFNEKTATIYSDFGFFSTKPAYYTDILKLFDYLEHDGLKEEIYDALHRQVIAGKHPCRTVQSQRNPLRHGPAGDILRQKRAKSKHSPQNE